MKNRVLSTSSLLFASVSAIIGSGWLFSAYYTSTLAGDASLISWLIGGFAVLMVAFTFAELSAFVPVTGASIRIPRYTHGVLIGFVFSWILWLSYVSLAVVEVQAMIQYANFFFAGLVYSTGGLTTKGYVWALILMLAITTINLYSLRWLIRSNNVLTVIKLLVPIVIAGAILAVQFGHHTLSLDAHHEAFMPYGIKGILAAITSGGVIFAFNGFRQASEMAGEAKDPGRAMPRAIIGAVLICLCIFLCLQVAFLSTIHSDNALHNWQAVKMDGLNSPFALVLVQSGLHSFMPILYVGAVIGPLAASLMYCGSSARALYAITRNGTLPPVIGHLNGRGVPVYAILINFIIGMCLFAPFPGWNNMANFMTSLMALTYTTAPISVLILHKRLGDQPRFFKLPFPILWSYVAFYICSLLFYWTGWQIVSKLYIALIMGLLLLGIFRFYYRDRAQEPLNWAASSWAWLYFIGMTGISYWGSFGGKGLIPFGLDFVLVGLLSVATLWLAGHFSFTAEEVKASIDELKTVG